MKRSLLGNQIFSTTSRRIKGPSKAVPLMSVGAIGVISVLSNILPKETHLMCKYALDGDFKAAGNLQIKYYNLINLLFKEVNPIPVKAALNLMGMIENDIRLPLIPMSDNNRQLLKEEMINLFDDVKEAKQ